MKGGRGVGRCRGSKICKDQGWFGGRGKVKVGVRVGGGGGVLQHFKVIRS